MLLPAVLAACGKSGPTLETRVERLQAQVLALEAADQENARVLGHLIAQNAQMRTDLADAQARAQSLQDRIDAAERRETAGTIAGQPDKSTP